MKRNKEFYITNILKNKRIYYEYTIISEINAGICLNGWEVKSLRNKKININNSYVSIKNREIFLFESNFTPMIYSKEKNIKYIKNRPRKLLLHKNEIDILYGKIKNKSLNIVVLSIFWKNNIYAKIKIGIAKKKNFYNKKLLKQKREWDIKKNFIKNKY